MNAVQAATTVGDVEHPQCPHTHSGAEAAQLIGMSERTLLDKAGRREVPSTKAGREVRFSDEDIAQIITGSRRSPAPPRRRAGRRS